MLGPRAPISSGCFDRSAVAAVLVVTACDEDSPDGSSTSSTSSTGGTAATCEPLTRVKTGFGVDVCTACQKQNCCAQLNACDGNDDCVACTKDEDPVDTKACNGDPNFGLPEGVYTKLQECTGASCQAECDGVSGEACIPSDCAVSCAKYPSCQ